MKKIRFFSKFLLLSLIIFSCATVPKISGPGETFLWEVKSETNSVYLLGSIHVAKEELYPLDDRIMNAFDNSEVLGLEILMDEIDPMAAMQMGMFEDGTTLKDVIADSTYKKLKETAAGNPVALMVLDKLKPHMIGNLLTMFEMQKAGYNPENGIDQYFLAKARDKDMKVIQLETIEYQMEILSRFDDYPDAYLNSTIAEIDRTLEMVDTMFEAWQSGDVETMQAILDETDKYPDLADIMDELIDKRNEKMTEKIIKYLEDDKNYFVVVGSGHLVGESGIVNMLLNSGNYEIIHY